ncbi:MAG: enoyl-CoA hydratase/isomerase family protein [Chlamydiia bacterium]|nr:enoyl-CoA hydratase/isomerase family protein [Chlamydiia bacterium]
MTAQTEEILQREGAIRLYQTGDGIGIVNFLSKANCCSLEVLQGLHESVEIAEKSLTGLIIHQTNDKFFSVGANLSYVAELAKTHQTAAIHSYLSFFQETSLKLKYAKVPIIAAVRGYALGGGCEIAMHCDRIVAHPESKIGLVESAIGLIPSGGGCKEMILRASYESNPQNALKRYFLNICQGKISTNADEAREMGYLRSEDIVTSPSEDLLERAKMTLTAFGKKSPPVIPTEIKRESDKETLIDAYREVASEPTPHDLYIVTEIANVFSCHDFSKPTDEKTLLQWELEAFDRLALNPLTIERIEYTLKTGKHLRN